MQRKSLDPDCPWNYSTSLFFARSMTALFLIALSFSVERRKKNQLQREKSWFVVFFLGDLYNPFAFYLLNKKEW